jgi:hypothetical protein
MDLKVAGTERKI